MDGALAKGTPEEIQVQIREVPKLAAWQDAMEAQTIYTAMMTDTMLEV